MTSAIAGFISSMGIALIIVALTLKGRKAVEVIDSLSAGAVNLVEAVLGQKP